MFCAQAAPAMPIAGVHFVPNTITHAATALTLTPQTVEMNTNPAG